MMFVIIEFTTFKQTEGETHFSMVYKIDIALSINYKDSFMLYYDKIQISSFKFDQSLINSLNLKYANQESL